MSANGGARPGPPRPPADETPDPIRVRFWGVRGSVPVPGRATLRYGGNTACVEVRHGRQIIIFDAGTGLRTLGHDLIRQPLPDREELWILLSHTHWDHIQGFPFFAPAYQASQHIRIVGPRGSRAGLRRTIAAAVESPFFPVALPDMPGNISVHQLTSRRFRVGSLPVSTAPLSHPGGGVAFRLETHAGSIVYVPDHEIPCLASQPTPPNPPPRPHPGMSRLVAEADLLIHDAQYTVKEYALRRGWGHSCVDAVVRSAAAARVRHLVLFHHDPERSDRQLDRLVQDARSLARSLGSPMKVEAAREGLEIALPLNPPK